MLHFHGWQMQVECGQRLAEPIAGEAIAHPGEERAQEMSIDFRREFIANRRLVAC
jgi:hypothetical protein